MLYYTLIIMSIKSAKHAGLLIVNLVFHGITRAIKLLRIACKYTEDY